MENTKLKIAVSENLEKGYLQISFDGALDTDGFRANKLMLDEVVKNNNYKYLLLDFDKLSYINSESIGYFFSIYETLIAKDVKIVFINVKNNVEDVLMQIGMLKLVKKYSNLNEFLNNINNG